MAEIRNFKIKRGSIKAQISRIQKYICKPETAEVGQIEIRLNKLHNLWDEFNQIQDDIELLVDDDEQNAAERESFENLYFELVSNSNKIIYEHSNQASVTHNETQNTAANITSKSQVKLPTINLPNFDGSYEHWLEFHDTFDSLIHQSRSINDIEKFHYLKSCLKNEAAQTIQSLEVSATNYNVAWSLLRERFENKRLIANNHIKSLFNLPTIVKESHVALRQMFDTLTRHLRALQSLGLPTDSWDALIIYLVSSKLDSTTRREWESCIPGTNLPKFSEFITFLKVRCDILETIHNGEHETVNNRRCKGQKESSNTRVHLTTNLHHKTCVLCKGPHALYHCNRFVSLSPTARISEVKRLKLCLNCLKSNHFTKDCKSSKCKSCNQGHNTLLHIKRLPTDHASSSSSSSSPDSVEKNNLSSLNSISNDPYYHKAAHILLATTLIKVRDTAGNQHICRALLDTGSQSNFATYDLCKKLNLSKSKAHTSITGISQVELQLQHKVQINFQSCHGAFNKTISCLLLPNITGNIPTESFSSSELNIPKNIQLADPTFNKSGVVDMLLGASIFFDLLCVGQISSGKNKPILQKTLLGWTVAGPIATSHSTMHCNISRAVPFNQESEIQKQISKFWELENHQDDYNSIHSEEQRECENHFLKNTKRGPNGRFVVKIPFKQEINKLGNAKNIALKRFYAMERKLNKNPELKMEYVQFMQEYSKLNHMTEISDDHSRFSLCYYLPHHPVLREESMTTRLRVVFDGSCKTDTGISLNDTQLVGPCVQDDLFSIVVRFRKHPIVITADIAKMYRQILIDESQRDLQRILWRDDPAGPVKCYQLNTVTYGTASAPYLATRCLYQLSVENQEKYPKASSIIKHDFYVDDLLTGANTAEEALTIHHEVVSILESAQFELRKWTSNNKAVLETINSKFDSSNSLVQVCKDSGQKTLGIMWNSDQDTLQFNVKEVKGREPITKRTILSTIAQIYDPLGLIGPVTIIAKIIMQKLWKLKVSWDESIQGALHSEWVNFKSQLQLLNELKIGRHVLCSNPTTIEMHGFCDSSESAYGACIFIRSTNILNEVTIKLVCAKSRVAPLKNVTLPRLELCGALLLAQLSNKVKNSIHINFDQIYYWCDSTIVLSWIHSPSYRWKTFVANRVAEIQNLTQVNQWRHIGSSENSADLISRGLTPEKLLNSNLWWNGPEFLSKEQDNWPKANITNFKFNNSNCEMRSETKVLHVTVNEFCLFKKYSSLTKLQRITAYVLRFLFNSRTPSNERRKGQLQVQELQDALLHLAKRAQYESLRQDLHNLQTKSVVCSKGSLLKLSPFICKHGLIRVGGRLRNSHYNFDKRHPIVLPPKHILTKLILKNEHEKLLHCGPQTLLSSIRDHFWPLSGRTLARKIVHECILCFRTAPKSLSHIMGNLPETRITQAPPFYNCGVDYAGPFLLRDKRSRGFKIIKSYVCLFICLATKAIHIELVSDLTSEAFIAALRRFCSRRGKPLNMYSDNATNFVKANSDLKELATFLENDNICNDIKAGLTNEGINWHFIPPRSPHFGGLWEAGIKSVKQHLLRVFRDASLVYEEFNTVLNQIEAILNSRPLFPLSSDPTDPDPLTPAHFLIGKKLVSVPDPSLTEIKENKLSRYQRLQQLVQHFWRRWSKEYISELQQRTKWNKAPEQRLKPGTMVVLKEDNQPPLSWKLGRIIETHPGKDGIIRVVTVKTATSVLKRAVVKICVLPIDRD